MTLFVLLIEVGEKLIRTFLSLCQIQKNFEKKKNILNAAFKRPALGDRVLAPFSLHLFTFFSKKFSVFTRTSCHVRCFKSKKKQKTFSF